MKQRSLRYTWWTLIVLANIFFIIASALPHYNHHSLPGRYDGWLRVHISAGIIAILSGPVQFIFTAKRQIKHMHRLLGRLYLCAILIGSLSALVLAIGHNILIENKIVFGTGLCGLAIAWIYTSGMALTSILKKRIAQHKEWMIKSYVVTCGFTTFRIFAALLIGLFHFEPQTILNITAWTCWILPLFIAEAVLLRRRIRKVAVHVS